MCSGKTVFCDSLASEILRYVAVLFRISLVLWRAIGLLKADTASHFTFSQTEYNQRKSGDGSIVNKAVLEYYLEIGNILKIKCWCKFLWLIQICPILVVYCLQRYCMVAPNVYLGRNLGKIYYTYVGNICKKYMAQT